MSRSEFHRYLSRDLISEIMAELFARDISPMIISNTMGKRETINAPAVGDGFRAHVEEVEAQRVRNDDDFVHLAIIIYSELRAESLSLGSSYADYFPYDLSAFSRTHVMFIEFFR